MLRIDERLREVQEEMERFLAEARARGEHWALEANLAVDELRCSTAQQRAQWRTQLRERF